jgi:HEAT repeat protein
VKEHIMNSKIRVGMAAAFLLAGGAATAAAADLAGRVAQQDGWVAWQVPMAQSVGMACCYAWHQGKPASSGCDLDGHSWNISTNEDDPHPAAGDNLSIFVHVAHGQIDKARAFSASCELRNPEQVRWIDQVASPDSIAFLAAAAEKSTEELADVEISAVAMHADPAATTALARLTDTGHARKLREQSLFWLGQARGADGARIVERVATTDSDAELRAHAVFALSQTRDFDGYASIHRIAQHDKSEHVREQALFWMAQTGDKRAKSDIFAAIASETSDKVREQAVFALSQLKEGEAETALIALVRGDYPRKVKEQALFWLGQSGSTQAIDFLDEVLTRTPAKPGTHSKSG